MQEPRPSDVTCGTPTQHCSPQRIARTRCPPSWSSCLKRFIQCTVCLRTFLQTLEKNMAGWQEKTKAAAAFSSRVSFSCAVLLTPRTTNMPWRLGWRQKVCKCNCSSYPNVLQWILGTGPLKNLIQFFICLRNHAHGMITANLEDHNQPNNITPQREQQRRTLKNPGPGRFYMRMHTRIQRHI